MLKKFFIAALTALSMSSYAINLNCIKAYGVNRGGLSQQHGILKDCFSRHFYEIRITSATPADTNKTYTIRVLPLLKLCNREIVFPYYSGIIEKNGIKLDCKYGFVCVYVSPLTRWTKDAWPNVIGDWSNGLVNNTVFIELICDNDGKIIRRWTNAATPAFRNAKSIDDGMSKMSKNLKFIEWLKESVNPNLNNTLYFDKEPYFETMPWKEYKAKTL